MSRTRWVVEPTEESRLASSYPALPALEAVYVTDPGLVAEVLPPPLSAPPEPRVHVRITDIDLRFGAHRHKEMVGYFAVDALLDGQPGEYPLLIPIDLESAVYISRERYGEPKKLADITLSMTPEGAVEGRITREGVTFIEMRGQVTGEAPVPDPYPASQFWIKFLPAVDGNGFDGDPLLVRLEQVRTPEKIEQIEGELILRDLASCPVADLPVRELVSMQWVLRSSENTPKLVGPVDAAAFAPYAPIRYR
jgi:acetoacetate decarboxylase